MRFDSSRLPGVQTLARALPIVLLLIALAYGGLDFVRHFATAIPQDAGGGKVVGMVPGDHFEQFYRYSLVKYNLSRGNWPYFSGYQYAVASGEKPFMEDWSFFPFSALSAALALVIGDIAAYNTIAVLSYLLAGLGAFWLVREITGSTGAGFLAGVIYAALPFRTGFLYGEMVFGLDMGLLPFIVLFLERACRTRQVRDAGFFGLSVLLLATANFVLLYWFVVMSSPYLAFRAFWLLRRPERGALRAVAIGAAPLLVLAAAYLLFVWTLLAASGLGTGQAMQELRVYSPDIFYYFTRPSGKQLLSGLNEQMLYLGFALAALIVWLAARGLVAFAAGSRERAFTWVALACFVIPYVMTLGINLDKHVGIGIYETMFKHLPGASGDRTPGRLMGVAGFWFTVLVGIAWAQWVASREWLARNESVAVALAALVVALDYWYTKPTMVQLDLDNRAYEAAATARGRVLGLPFQSEPHHYYNSSFLPYALKYDLRMFNGHSSMYPREYRAHARRLQPLNAGELSEENWIWLRNSGFKYIVVHNTAYEPKVGDIALARLKVSPLLKLVAEDSGITAFEISEAPVKALAPADREQEMARLLQAIPPADRATTPLTYLTNWHALEKYPGQEPFRWMQGPSSVILWRVPAEGPTTIRLRYKCPLGDLEVRASGGGGVQVSKGTPDAKGWRPLQLTADRGAKALALNLSTEKEYRVPTDSRVFGCMISAPDSK